MSPESDHKIDQRAGASPLQEQAERAGTFQPGKEKTLADHSSSLPVHERGLQESWKQTFYRGM